MSAVPVLDELDCAPASLTPATMPLLLRSAPRREPPFDDEQHRRHLSLVGPLDQPLPFDAASPAAAPPVVAPDPGTPRPTGRAELPEPATFARRFLIGVIETATGRRPASQLRQHTSPTVHAGLARDAGRIDRLGTARRPATLQSVHITEPADAVAEVAAVLRVGDRFRALALRLEGSEGRWRCVRLQIG
jgi:hypothetical protein